MPTPDAQRIEHLQRELVDAIEAFMVQEQVEVAADDFDAACRYQAAIPEMQHAWRLLEDVRQAIDGEA